MSNTIASNIGRGYVAPTGTGSAAVTGVLSKASLMGPRLIVLVNPDIEIGLQLVDETIHLFAERDTVKLVGQ